MPNITSVLNDQMNRIARRALSTGMRDSRKVATRFRRTIAALKRDMQDISRTLAGISKSMAREGNAPAPSAASPARLRVDGLKTHRAKLNLSAKDYGRLFGVSGLTIYNWENGKSKPRRSLLPKIVELRGIGKRDAYARLGINLSPAKDTTAKGKKTGGRSRGIFKRTGEEAILACIQSRKNPSTSEVNAAWKAEGRGGSADVLLGKMVASAKLRRNKIPGERGSRYTIA